MSASTMPMRLFVATALWFIPAGCGDGESIPPDEFPDRFAAAICASVDRCCLASGGTARGTCEADTRADVVRRAGEAEADGATWDGAAAARCIDLLSSIDCASFDAPALRDLNLTCNLAWTGVVPPGGACRTGSSCAVPDASDEAIGGASCFNDVCVQVVLQPPGAACSSSTLQSCDPYAASCIGGTCVALPGPGESCSESCRSDSRCADGTCVALLDMGQPCSSPAQCRGGTCSGGTCASGLIGDGDYCALPTD